MYKNRFPKRDNNHIRETFSYKVFSNSIPNQWIIRDLTERDYGTDVLIEYVTDSGEVTGKLASIQLKFVTDMRFSNSGEFRFYNIKPSTTDYWLSSNVPVYIFFINENKEMYFVSVTNYVNKNYERYMKQDTFYYSLTLGDVFSIERFIDEFKFDISFEANELLFLNIIEWHKEFKDYFISSYRKDDLMVLDGKQIEAMNKHYSHVYEASKKLSLPINARHITQIVDETDCEEMYEFHLTICLEEMDKQWISVSKAALSRMKPHIIYWANKNIGYLAGIILIAASNLKRDIYKLWGGNT
ncbi:TPA: DUF4365 domain-containing protein [Morganella morganii]